MTAARIALEQSKGVARLTIDHPARHNAMTRAMWTGLTKIVEDLEASPGTLAIVLRGSGKTFSSGADAVELVDTITSEMAALEYLLHMEAAIDRLAASSKPTVAVVRGGCYGAACAIVAACDLRFAEDGARFSITPAKLGLAYSLASTKRIVDLVGPARTKDLLFSARVVPASEAYDMGLVDYVLPSDELEAEADKYVSDVIRLSAYSHRVNKKNVENALACTDKDTDEIRQSFVAAFAGEDFLEGISAFRDKRQPCFPSNQQE